MSTSSLALLQESASPAALAWWEQCAAAQKPAAELFPALRRRFGDTPLRAAEAVDRLLDGEYARIDLAAMRICDVAAAAYLERCGGSAREIFDHGDLDERVHALRCLLFMPATEEHLPLLQQAHRSNAQDVFEAAFCDHDLAIQRLETDDFNRMILKMAFADIDLTRVFGASTQANPELTRMLSEFAEEREAAGRPIWVGGIELICVAPARGSFARIVGHLESGADDIRGAAAQHCYRLGDRVREPLRERLDRETRPSIRNHIEHSLRQLEG